MKSIRSVIFWAHLVSGVTTALVILMMSVTGVLLTYERQMLAWADRGLRHDMADGEQHLPLETLLTAVKIDNPGFEPSSIIVSSDDRAPVAFAAGRAGSIYVDRYSAEGLGGGAPLLRAFFGAMTGWHRWFNVSGDDRVFARAITGASNLVFLFLIFSGLYLWLPRIWKWPAFRARLIFNSKAASTKARDFNWHHVFGIWSLLPLAVVVATAVVFSYGWANDFVYRTFDGEPPGRSARQGRSSIEADRSGRGIGLDELVAIAAAAVPDWRTLSIPVPGGSEHVTITADTGNGGQPQRRVSVTVNAHDGSIETSSTFADNTPGRRARVLIRYLHTGEALGIAGQTIAGLVSLTSVMMIWTGLALAYRRLIAPLMKRGPPAD